MDWPTFITPLLTSIGGTGALLAIAVFLGKKWLGTRIDESVKHEYAKKLEEHKATLQEQVNRSIQDMQAEFRDAVDAKATDKSLFAKFIATLPSSGSIEFVNNFNMAGWSFDRKNLDQLDVFYHDWGKPEHRFLNDEIDAKRDHLHKVTGEYLGYLALNTFCVKGDPERSSVPEEWEEEQPERFQEVVGRLHELAGQLVAAHGDLVKTARAKLKC